MTDFSQYYQNPTVYFIVPGMDIPYVLWRRIRILEAELASERAEHLKTQEAYTRLIREVQGLKVEHGVSCYKALHAKGIRYLHADNDDSPYDVDGVMYCGRCHVYLSGENFKP